MNGYETEREIRVTKERSVTGHKKGFLQEMTEVWDEQEKKETRILSPILGTGPLVLNRGSTGGDGKAGGPHPTPIHPFIHLPLPAMALLTGSEKPRLHFFLLLRLLGNYTSPPPPRSP